MTMFIITVVFMYADNTYVIDTSHKEFGSYSACRKFVDGYTDYVLYGVQPKDLTSTQHSCIAVNDIEEFGE